MGKNLGGRPAKDIDRKTFEKLCGIQATKLEICSFFDCTDKTLEHWVKRTYGCGFSEVFKAKRGLGNIALRRTMWQSAEKGNTAMLIFLSKNYLGMSDNVKVEASADGKLADLIDGLRLPPNDIHTETAGADVPLADGQAQTNQSP